MSVRDTQILLAAIIFGFEAPECLLRLARQPLSNIRQHGRNRIDTQKRALSRTGGKPRRKASFRAYADKIESEGRPVSTETAPLHV